MDKNITIQKHFKRVFGKVVLLTFMIIVIICLVLLSKQAEKEQEKKMLLAGENVVDTLNRELSDYSMQLSYFITANGREVIELLNQHNELSGQERYIYDKKLEEKFGSSLALQLQVVSLDFYMKDMKKYSFKDNYLYFTETLTSQEWYQDSLNNPDKVRINIINVEDSFYRTDLIDGKNVLAFSIMTDRIGAGSSVNMANMCVDSDTIRLIENVDTWSDRVSIYIMNKNGKKLVSSEDSHLEEAYAIFHNETPMNSNIRYSMDNIRNTGWKVITIVDGDAVTSQYRNIIFILSCGIGIMLIFIYYFVNNLLKNILNPLNELTKTMEKTENNSTLQKCEVNGLYEVQVIQNTYNNMIHRISNLMRLNEKKEQEKHEEEMKVLELQLNPHFLSNTLGSIRFMAIVAKFEGIQKMTEALINILNSSFRNSYSFHTLKEEIKVIDSFIYIMQIRYVNNFEVFYRIENGCEDCLVPKLFMQPFLENTITHGFEDNEDIGEIRINIKRNENNLDFSIWDNGCGIREDRIQDLLNKEPQNGNKIGIANINKRLKLYYGDEYKIRIESELGKFTEVKFSIPYREE
ncbi:sensor histidine kinase [Clostridium sp. DL1XJH146]